MSGPRGRTSSNRSYADNRSQQSGSASGLDDFSHFVPEEERELLNPVPIVPPNQVQLTNQEKFEDVQRTLQWTDPNVALNEVKFMYKQYVHKRFPAGPEDHMAIHFAMDGCSVFEDSEDAKAQRLREKATHLQTTAEELMENNDIAISTSREGAGGIKDTRSNRSGSLNANTKNEFNYAERACQTSTVPVREIGITTIPPAMETFSTTVSQWQIYDFFFNALQQERRDVELAEASKNGAGTGGSSISSLETSEASPPSSRLPSRAGTAGSRRGNRSLINGPGGVEEALAIKSQSSNSALMSSASGSSAAMIQQQHQEMKNAQGGGKDSKDGNKKAKEISKEEIMRSNEMMQALQVLERIVNQNREDDIYTDYRYWEDDSDQFKEGGQGSLLPLWRFTSDRTKQKHITSVAWHPTYPDLFAVSYGSFDFSRQTEGLVYCYSLKNTSYPEYMFNLDCGAMCLDWHPQHHALLCVGCYDGSVVVYDVRLPGQEPIFKSTVRTGKHTDPVWQVHWQEEDVSKGLNFFSVSSDGVVANWTLTNTELRMETLMRLEKIDGLLETPAASPSSGTINTQEATEPTVSKPLPSAVSSSEAKYIPTIAGLEAGVCVDFNKHSDHLFIVGTEEGHIHKCSKAYSGQYLQSYTGHDMTVYSLQWNPFHPQIFISCSCDWTVKVWRHNRSEPQLTLSLGDTVGDVRWAPYSSTVFAAVTNDGFVHVFDLEVNRHEPICKQKVVKRSKLTKLRFARWDAVLLIGDENGSITSLKLSPNLRRNMKETKGVYDSSIEQQRLDAALRIGLQLAS